MFLRRHRKRAENGESYEYWSLCESVRTERGPRQRVVATLGKLTGPTPGEEAGWEELEALLEGRQAREQLELGQKPQEAAPRWETVDISRMRVERVREFGGPFLALSLWRRLGLHRLLGELVDSGREEVPWHVVASVLAVARFCGQPSELGIAEAWYERTALEDLTGVPAAKVNDDRLYRALDVLAAHKDRLCGHLMERYRDWFGVRFEFLLYDVTSTYFEGQAEGNEKAARGYSRDGRSDCKQVCIGLVCTPEGLPLSYKVFAGNRTDVTTVEEIVTEMEEVYGQAERVWVMDRGMVSEANIQWLRERKARYLVGTPKGQLKNFEADLLDKEGWHEVQSGLEAKLVPNPDGKGKEQFVLCRSNARAEKERAMLDRQLDKLREELDKVGRALRRKPTADPGKIAAFERRIGRWQGRYPAAAKVLDARIRHDKNGAACDLEVIEKQQSQWARLSHGAYLLRTNCTETDPARLWRWYVQLTQAEAAFRTAKSDLGLRPIYHQKADRVDAHILVCFLALAMWRTLEMWMQGKGLGTCARKLVAEISTIRSMDVVLPVKRGEEVARLRVRTVARPERRVAELLQRLDMQLPQRNKILEEASSLTSAKM